MTAPTKRKPVGIPVARGSEPLVLDPKALGIDLTPSQKLLDLINKIEHDAYEAERSMRDFIIGRPTQGSEDV